MSDDKFKALRVAVLQTGRTPAAIIDKHSDYDEMCKAFLGRAPEEADTFAVLDGEFPESLDAYDVVLVTGSRHSVYENNRWIEPLENLLRQAHARRQKIVGICFGHQILAQALGGVVVKSEKGLGAGVMRYAYTTVNGDDCEISLCVWHQDQVITPPDQALVIATSDFCEYAALRYGDHAISFQAHPEFSRDYVADLIEERQGDALSEDEADKARATLLHDIDNGFIADEIKKFIIG